jgi:hypothetical protein
MSKPQGLVRLEEFKLKKIIHLILSRTRNHLACSTAPQALRYRVPNNNNNNNNDNSIQFIYVQNLTSQRPITKLAQARK